jgi:hypothetical protein
VAAVLFHAPGDMAYREADEADPVQCLLRDELVRELEKHSDLVTVILGRGTEQSWELQSIDPDDDDARFLAASVTARVAGSWRL